MKRRSKRDTQTTRSRLGRRELALYDGTHLLGTIKVAADGRSVAYSAGGKKLGSFPTFEAVTAAFPKSAA